MEVLISLQGADKTSRLFNRVSHNMSDVSQVWPVITEAIAKSNARSWGHGVQLAPSTIERKQQDGDPEPLVRTGDLKRSLTELTAPHAVREFGPYEMKFGTSLFYSRFIQSGTKNMPKRRVLRFTITSRKLVQKLLMDHILGRRR